MQYKKTLVTVLGALTLAVLVSHNLAFAADLGQAASTLPGNDEWSIMARAALGQTSGEGFLAQPLNSNLATDYEKRILAITAIGRNPATIGSENFISKLESMYNGGQIGDPSLLNDDIFGLLALNSAGISNSVTSGARSYILSHQNSDGGWGYAVGVGSDSNTTGVAVAALRTTGSAPASAISYLQSSQSSSGGYGFTPGLAGDGASTAWVMWGLRAAQQSIPVSANDFMDSLQLSNGSFKWRSNDSSGSALVTAYAVIALSGHTLPVNTVNNPPPADICQDHNATNFGGPLPCTYPQARTNDATCVSISAPANVFVSDQFQASVTMRNIGTKVWSASDYRLGSQNPQDNASWGKTRVNLSTDVQPGQNFNFTFTATAPGVAGNYPFEWKMVQEFVQWFGSSCSANITVSSSPPPAHNPPVGAMDVVDCNIIGGWAFDPDNSSGQSVVEIFANGPQGTGTKIFSGLTNTLRPDVNAAFNISGSHGFTISMPQSLKDGANHEIWIYVQGSSTHLDALINHRTFDSSACVTLPQICEDHNAANFGGPLPCTYPPPPASGDYQVSISYPANKIFNSTVSGPATPLQALIMAAGQISLLYTIKQTGLGQFVQNIDGYGPSGSSGWQYAVNGTVPQVGASDYSLKPGDRVQWFYGAPGISPY